MWFLLGGVVGTAGAMVGYLVGSRGRALPPPQKVEETVFIGFDAATTNQSDLLSGWGRVQPPEPAKETKMWCQAKSCTVRLHSRADGNRVIRMRVGPFLYPESPPQILSAYVNDTAIGVIKLSGRVAVYTLRAKKEVWVRGPNDLRFDFAYAKRPVDTTPDNKDTRTLAAVFDWIHVMEDR